MTNNAPEEETYYNSESEGKEYKINDEIFKDFDEKYDNYIQATNEDTYGDQGSEQQEDRTVSPPSNFPHFP